MSEKQDRQGARTAADIERKYNMNWGKPFAELAGVSRDTRQQVERVEAELRGDMDEGFESAAEETKYLIEQALINYVKTADLESFRQTVDQALLDMSGRIDAFEDNAPLLAYPVNSVFFTAGETSPEDLFGGTWEKLSGTLPFTSSGTTGDTGTNGEQESGADTTVQISAWRRTA